MDTKCPWILDKKGGIEGPRALHKPIPVQEGRLRANDVAVGGLVGSKWERGMVEGNLMPDVETVGGI